MRNDRADISGRDVLLLPLPFIIIPPPVMLPTALAGGVEESGDKKDASGVSPNEFGLSLRKLADISPLVPDSTEVDDEGGGFLAVENIPNTDAQWPGVLAGASFDLLGDGEENMVVVYYGDKHC